MEGTDRQRPTVKKSREEVLCHQIDEATLDAAAERLLEMAEEMDISELLLEMADEVSGEKDGATLRAAALEIKCLRELLARRGLRYKRTPVKH